MADDLKVIDTQIDTAINPAALPGQILALSHNSLLHALLATVGKFAGYPFTAKDTTPAPQGSLLWNGNAMDKLTAFTLTVSELTADGNDFGDVLSNAVNGDIIKFKDFEGRAALLTYLSHVASDDGQGNNTYDLSVTGFVENPSFTYTIEENICILEILPGGGSGIDIYNQNTPLVIKDPANTINLNIIEAGDWVKTRIGQKIIEGIYVSGSILLEGSYTILNEIDLTP